MQCAQAMDVLCGMKVWMLLRTRYKKKILFGVWIDFDIRRLWRGALMIPPNTAVLCYRIVEFLIT
jgi:hypothetical protein